MKGCTAKMVCRSEKGALPPFSPGFFMPLLAQTEPLDKRPVALHICFFQVVEHVSPASDHLQKARARMKILRVGLEMIAKLLNARREERDLHFRRACVSFVLAIGIDHRFLVV